jgi:hypothetical protein
VERFNAKRQRREKINAEAQRGRDAERREFQCKEAKKDLTQRAKEVENDLTQGGEVQRLSTNHPSVS